METLRRAAASAVGLVLLASCAAGSREKESSFANLRVERRANVPAILALMPDSASAREAYNGLVTELGEDFDLVIQLVNPDTSPTTIARAIRAERPRAIVLMNNPTLRLFRQYQLTAPPRQRNIPAVALLTSFLRETSEGVSNLTGVIYEVPLVTSLVNLRALLDQPIDRVGVLYRPIFSRFVDEQRRLSAGEGFELIGVEVSGTDGAQIRQGLSRLRQEMNVDAIWVLNDNRLLSEGMLLRGWLPALRNNRTPVIVNARSLVSKDVSFGTFAVLPDHRALGTQTAQLISSLADRDWKIRTSAEFEYPISVEKVLDVKFARRNLEIKDNQLATIDQLVE